MASSVSSLSPTEVRACFSGDLPAAQLDLTYRVALAATAAAMVLLPLIYLLLAGAAAWGVWWWLGAGLTIFKHSTSIWSVLLYATPAVAGGILVAFLFKPLFAPREAASEPITVDLDAEPALRAYLEEICRRMDVALPAAVHLDSTANASASFRRGWRSLGQRDLVLTLGTPLVRSLSAQQLGGVIAHEFGHFAQRTGMVSFYVIRSINAWFGAVVFGRDSWDAWLVRNSETADWRIAAVLWCARGGVWLSRKILHGLMYVAHALSCWLSRQMEFDADYYAAQMEGSGSFAGTARRIALLAVAEAHAGNDLNAWWKDRRTAPDFAELIALRFHRLPANVAADLERAQREEKTHWHDTHPCMRERIDRVAALATRGILQCAEPATRLFGDFAALSRAATEALYRHAIGEQLKDAAPLAPAEIEQRMASDDARERALEQLTRNALTVDRPVLLTLAEVGPGAAGPHPGGAEHRAWFDAETERLRQALEADQPAFWRLQELAGARRFIETGVGVKAATFRLDASTTAAVDRAQAEVLQTRLAHDAVLTEARNRVRARLRAFAQLAHQHASRTEATQLRERLEAFASLAPFFTRLPQLLQLQSVVELFEVNQASLAQNQKFTLAYGAVRVEARQAFDEWLATAAAVTDPFATTESKPTVAQALLKAAGENAECHVLLSSGLSTALRLYFRLLGDCAALAAALEPEATPPAP